MAALPENDRIAGPFIALAGQTDFPADFPLLNPAALRVSRERAGSVSVLSGAAVTALDEAETGFTCRLSDPCQVGDLLFIYSRLPPARMRQHTPNGAVRTNTLEGDAVEFQAQLQEQSEQIARTLALPLGEAGLILPTAARRAGRFLAFDPDGVAMTSPGQVSEVPTSDLGAALVGSQQPADVRRLLVAAKTIFLDNMPGADDDARLDAALAEIPEGANGRIVFPSRSVGINQPHDFDSTNRGVILDGLGECIIDLGTAEAHIRLFRRRKGFGDPWRWAARGLTFTSFHTERPAGLTFENPYMASDEAHELICQDLFFTVANRFDPALSWAAGVRAVNIWNGEYDNVRGNNGTSNVPVGRLIDLDGLCAPTRIRGGACQYFDRRISVGWATLRGVNFAVMPLFHLYETVTQAATGATGTVVALTSAPDGGATLIQPLTGTFTAAGPITGQESGVTAAPTGAFAVKHPCEGITVLASEGVAVNYDLYAVMPADISRRGVGLTYAGGAHANVLKACVKATRFNQMQIEPQVTYLNGAPEADVALDSCAEFSIRGVIGSNVAVAVAAGVSLTNCSNGVVAPTCITYRGTGVSVGAGCTYIDVHMPPTVNVTTPVGVEGGALGTGTIRVFDAPLYEHPLGRTRIRHALASDPPVVIETTNAANGLPALIQHARASSSSANALMISMSAGTNPILRVQDNGQVFADGAYSSAGADYAEMFEWADGNPAAEDRAGWSVVLTGDRIRRATAGEEPLGVVSANPTVLGDAAGNNWSGRWEADTLGRVMIETVDLLVWTEIQPGETDARGAVIAPEIRTDHAVWADAPEASQAPNDAEIRSADRPVESAAYDPALPYIPRIERPEWAAVGLMGKLRLKPGEPVAPRWIKLRDLDDGVSEWLVR